MNCNKHSLYHSSSCTCTSNIVWFHLPRYYIMERNKKGYLFRFSYYDHNIKLRVYKTPKNDINAKVSFDLNGDYSPDVYTSLWIITKSEYEDPNNTPSYVHNFAPDEISLKK